MSEENKNSKVEDVEINPTEMAAKDVKDIVTLMQQIIITLTESDSRFIHGKFNEILVKLNKEVLPVAVEVSQGKIESAKRVMLGGKTECLALSFIDECEFYVLVPTMTGVSLDGHLFLVKKDKLETVSTIVE